MRGCPWPEGRVAWSIESLFIVSECADPAGVRTSASVPLFSLSDIH